MILWIEARAKREIWNEKREGKKKCKLTQV
jgi:hypothetical protein